MLGGGSQLAVLPESEFESEFEFESEYEYESEFLQFPVSDDRVGPCCSFGMGVSGEFQRLAHEMAPTDE
jgi:hypothetical protein